LRVGLASKQQEITTDAAHGAFHPLNGIASSEPATYPLVALSKLAGRSDNASDDPASTMSRDCTLLFMRPDFFVVFAR
jgi:hypothetical protein